LVLRNLGNIQILLWIGREGARGFFSLGLFVRSARWSGKNWNGKTLPRGPAEACPLGGGLEWEVCATSAGAWGKCSEKQAAKVMIYIDIFILDSPIFRAIKEQNYAFLVIFSIYQEFGKMRTIK